ncbi:MAG: carboxypeptidase-like regulatory domain-containing protein [Prolixibacteraceae bacterium]
MLNKAILLLFVACLISFSAFAKIHVAGYVKDELTGEKLIGAYVIETGTSNGTSTDNNGYFSLVLAGNELRTSFIGYKTKYMRVEQDTLLIINLESGHEIETITVEGQRFQKFNVTSLNAKEIISIPAIGGKPDVIKTLQLLPGIQTQSEGTSLMNVRGGNPGENLYLIDNVPLIYMNHLGGFTSVFNPDMINSIEVYKGGFPARYGGKLSSVVAISQREGNKDRIKGSFGIGVTDVSISLEGPINDKVSFIVNGRKTLTDGLFLIASNLADQDFLVRYGFHDINAKVTWRPNVKNSVSFNVYQGDDYLHYMNKYKLHKEDGRNELQNIWGNWLASARWSSTLSPKLFVDNSVSFCRYRLKMNWDYKNEKDSVDFHQENISSVQDVRLSSDWKYKMNKAWSLNFGLQSSSLRYVPNKYYRTYATAIQDFEIINTNETALYLSNIILLFNKIEANIGGRFVGYINADYSDFSFEPRFSLNAQITKNHAINLSYQRVKQYSHLIFSAANILNNEVWVPASGRFKPSQSNQFSVGIKGSFNKQMFEHEISVYYKDMLNLSTYKEGYQNFLGDGGWRSKIETDGKGVSYGAEFLLKKVAGDWTGFAAYTYSKTTRQFPGINRGIEFLFDYDRPHAIAVNINKKLNHKWDFGMNWVYQTGLPYTPVLGRQMALQDNGLGEALIYGERNSGRINDYHRLDLGLTLHSYTKRGRSSEWVFSVYNAYNRKNAYNYLYLYSKDADRGYRKRSPEESLKLYQQSMFPILPTVAYKVYFDKEINPQQMFFKKNAKTIKKEEIANYTRKGRWNLKVGSTFSPVLKSSYGHMYSLQYDPFNRLNVSCGISEYLETGVYLGQEKYLAMVPANVDGQFFGSKEKSLHYGVLSNVHLAPLLPVVNHFMDIYVTGSLGVQRYNPPYGYQPNGTQFRYGLALGTSVFITKHIGAFAEYGIRKASWRNIAEVNYGLNIRF